MKLSQSTSQIRCKSGYKSIALELEEMGFDFAVKKQGRYGWSLTRKGLATLTGH
jgi:hypothetical protein